MSPLGTWATVAVCVWLGVLTIVMVLVVRQISLLTARLDSRIATPVDMDNDGLSIGEEVHESVKELIPETQEELTYVLVLSSTCSPCREIAPQLANYPRSAATVALVAGSPELATGLAEMLPPDLRVLRDPDAAAIAKLLRVESAPFALEVECGVITGKAYLHDASEFRNLMNARRQQSDLPEASGREVHAHA